MARKLLLLAVVLALALFVHADDGEPETTPEPDTETETETETEPAPNKEITCTKRREEFNACGNRCDEPRCNAPKEPLECTECQPGCYCTKGASRNDFNNCVPTSMCSYKNFIG